MAKRPKPPTGVVASFPGQRGGAGPGGGFTIVNASPLTPNATVCVPYAQTMTQLNGTPPIQWSLSPFSSGSIKANFGHYILADTVDGSQAPYGSGAFKGWIDMLATTGTGGNWPGSPFLGMLFYYSWSVVQTVQGTLDKVQGIINDFLYLQSKCPGAHMMVGVSWYNFAWHVNPAGINNSVTGSAVPPYILNNPGTFGAGYNGQGGYGLSNWNGAQWNWTTAALWNTNVMNEWIAFWQLLSNVVIPDGGGFTFNTHPLIEQMQDWGELSVDYITTGGGISNPNPTYTRAAFDTNWFNYIPTINNYFTKTGWAPYDSFGLNPGGDASNTEVLHTIELLATTKGGILSNADVYGNTTPNNGMVLAQANYIGWVVPPGQSTLVQTGIDYRPKIGYSATIQQLDYGSPGPGTNYTPILQGIWNTAVGQLQAQYIIWAGQDESNPGLGMGLTTQYIAPFAATHAVNTTKPGNF